MKTITLDLTEEEFELFKAAFYSCNIPAQHIKIAAALDTKLENAVPLGDIEEATPDE